MSASHTPMLPWILVDPECPEWAEAVSVYSLGTKAAELLGRSCSAVVGAADLAEIRRRASESGDRTYRVLFEALSACPRRVRGDRALDVDESMAHDDNEAPVYAAIVSQPSDATLGALMSGGVRVARSAAEFVLGELKEGIDLAARRVYPPNTGRDVIWDEVLEPFSRTSVLSIHESYIFNSFASDRWEWRRTGLYWILDRMRSRALQTGDATTVVVRGGLDPKRPDPSTLERMRSRFVDVEREFRPWIRLVFEPVSQATHDRYMIARRPDNSSRLLEYGYPIISEFGDVRHSFGGIREGRLSRTLSFTYDSDPRNVNVRIDEWNRERSSLLSSRRRA